MNYYNDNDSFVCKWLQCLIRKGHLPDGSVDARSIVEVVPSDLGSFRQCHFFAGIGGWAHALALAQWPEEREIWTASLPCQPLSVAGLRQGALDGRHLWPAFHRLVAVCRPPTIVGEQVASADGREWFAGVRVDLEELGYACGAAIMPASAVGAPHRRERLYWCAVADAASAGSSAGREDDGEMRDFSEAQCQSEHSPASSGRGGGANGGMGDAAGDRWREDDGLEHRATGSGAVSGCATGASANGGVADAERAGSGAQPAEHGERSPRWRSGKIGEIGDSGGVADAESSGSQRQSRPGVPREGRSSEFFASRSSGFWGSAEWRVGVDGKARRVKPGIRLLADGFPNRVGALRGFGNAIVAPLAAEFIKAVMEC